MAQIHPDLMRNEVEAAILKLIAYCQANNWAGYDPYDALNSKAFEALPILNSRFPRLAFTQALKWSPLIIRRLALVPKTQNPKAIALFLSAFIKLAGTGLKITEGVVSSMIELLIALRSHEASYWCWGYSFPWQTRTIMAPVGAPNVVCTSFAANALLDAYEISQDPQCLRMAASAAEYLINELYWTEGGAAGFSYPLPSIRSRTHNANLLAAALLCRVYKHTGDRKFLGPALSAARYSVGRQRLDGSWYYGEASSQRWIDNFHTGYNLCALKSIGGDLDTDEFDSCMRRGFEFYRTHFFCENGAVRYFHNHTYPIDIHCVAQGVITLLTFADLHPGNVQLARLVFQWTMSHMWDDRGFFYYRVLRLCTIRTPYMRWSQAWMLLALSILLQEANTTASDSRRQYAPALV